jgi:hypothetical protein
MTSLVLVEIPATTAGTTMGVALVYRYLMVQPDPWLRQAFFIGRPKSLVSRVVEAVQVNGQSLEEAAPDGSLPVSAITEALDYYQRFHDVIESNATEELTLSAALARECLPV